MQNEKSVVSTDGAEFSPILHRTFVKNLINWRVRNAADAEDISQEVLTKTWKWATANHKLLPEQEWKKLVAKIAYNEINRFYSRRNRLFSTDENEADYPDAIDESPVPNLQKILEISCELKSLPLRQRLPLLLGDNGILGILSSTLSDEHLAEIFELDLRAYHQLEQEMPFDEHRIRKIIEELSGKSCKASIRNERSKGKRNLWRKLFG